MEYWARCETCGTETNSPKMAAKHEHDMIEEWEDGPGTDSTGA